MPSPTAPDLATEFRSRVDALLAQQTEHPVWQRLRVNWSQPHDMQHLWVDCAGTMECMPLDRLMALHAAREGMIEDSVRFPLHHTWEPDICRLTDIEICRKRLAHPGEVIELMVDGGQRPGKTQFCARRLWCSFLYTEKSWCWALHQTDETSRTIQQKRMMDLLPPELNPESGKMKKDRNTKFTWTAGTGFTGAQLILTWLCKDEHDREFTGGGELGFKFYKQDFGTFQGSELTCAWSDELVPLKLVKTIKARLSTRAADTARPEFLDRIRDAMGRLERGERLPAPLLGAIYHSVHLISFTPADGWTSTVSYFLHGARKYGHEISPDLVGRPGVTDVMVPRFAQPADDSRLVCYMFTSDNKIKNAYPALSAALKNASEANVRIFLHGDVDKDWQSRFHGYHHDRHVKTWKDVPPEGTVYEVIDPAGAKPWVIVHFLCDAAGRHWLLQEWPCTVIPIDGALPGPWAVPSEGEDGDGDKRNGDAGPGQRLRLNYARAKYLHVIWSLRKRLAEKLHAVHESNIKVRTEARTLTWEGSLPELKGPFVLPAITIMDSRYARVRTEIKGVSKPLLEAMMEEENGVPMEPASGDEIYEGDQFIQQELAAEVLGLPGLMVLDECTNSQFTLATYCVPEHREDAKATDDKCKDFRDPIAYYLLSDPQHTAHIPAVHYVTDRQKRTPSLL